MKSLSRDLLLLSKKTSFNKKEMESEVQQLNKILLDAESIENLCLINEIIDLNNYKIIQDPLKIERIIRINKFKAFQFLNNKN